MFDNSLSGVRRFMEKTQQRLAAWKRAEESRATRFALMEPLEARQMLSALDPDLRVLRVVGPTGNVPPGLVANASVTVINSGKSVAGESIAQVVLSTDKTFGNEDDILLFDASIPSLAAGKNFVANASVTLPENIASGKYNILARADNFDDVAEANESNNVFVGGVVNVVRPTLSLTTGVNKAAETGGKGTFIVTRTGGSLLSSLQAPIEITGTAIRGVDYQLMVGKDVLEGDIVTFNKNQGSITVNVVSIDDTLIEGNETVAVKLTAPGGDVPPYQINAAKNGALVNIIDDEPTVKLTVNSTKMSETKGFVIATLARSGGSTKSPLTVFFEEPTGSAVFGSDYQFVSMDGKTTFTDSITFKANAASMTFKIVAIDDQLIEGDESFTVKLGPGPGEPSYSIDSAKNQFSVTITDNEPMVSLFTATTKTSETKGSVTFTLSRAGGSTTSPLEVFIASSGSAIMGTDYKLVSMDGKTTFGDSVTLKTGAASMTFKAVIIDDTLIEGDESFTLTLVDSPGTKTYTINPSKNSSTVTITDNEPMVSLFTATTKTNETKGSVTFTLSRAGGSTTSPLEVFIASSGSAIMGTDYKLVSMDGKTTFGDSVTLKTGAASMTFKAVIIDDTLIEGDESFTLTLVDSPGARTYTINPSKNSSTVTIADNEPTVRLELVKSGASETNASSNKGQFKLTRTGGDTSSPLTVNFTVSGSATFGTDYKLTTVPTTAGLTVSGSSGSVTFGKGVSSITIDLTALPDTNTKEGNETATLTLNSTSAFALDPTKKTGTVTISDGAAPPPTPGAMDVGILGDSLRFTVQDTFDVIPQTVTLPILGTTKYNQTTAGGTAVAESGRSGLYGYIYTTMTGATKMMTLTMTILGTSAAKPTDEYVVFQLTFSGTRPISLHGKTIQFLTTGTAGAQGTFTANALTVNNAATQIKGSFKIV